MDDIYILLFDKETKQLSNEIPLKELLEEE